MGECMPVIAAHGGAGHWRTARSLDTMLGCLRKSLEEGMAYLLREGALIGVLRAVMVMEDCGEFNAGLGSVPNSEGVVEMDAGIMDGSSGDAGAVASIRGVKNPVLLAYNVMKKTSHVLIAGEGAERLAEALGLEKAPFATKRRAEPHLRERIWANKQHRLVGDTVGAVALDSDCRLAAASSTGGLIGKMPGRIGDSPIPGAGFFANREAAVVATGIGEIILLEGLSRRAVEYWRSYRDIGAALRRTLEEITSLYGPDTVGLLGVDVMGKVSGEYNTEAMPWGYLREGEKAVILGLPKT